MHMNIEESLATDVEDKVATAVKKAVEDGVRRGVSEALQQFGSGKKVVARSRSRKGRRTGTPFEPLTDTQQDVLRVIQTFMDEHGKSPTYAEIADTLDKSGVATIVHAIEKKGWIGLDNTKFSRKIELLHRL